MSKILLLSSYLFFNNQKFQKNPRNCDNLSHEFVHEMSLKEEGLILEILKKYESEKGNLISILQRVQQLYRFLPSNVLNFISKELEIPLAEVYSIATFYTQFKFQSLGKNTIICCDGTSCHVKNAVLFLTFLENELGIRSGETTEDKLFSIESVSCLGCCAISPVCVINGQIYGDLTIMKLKKILKNLKEDKPTNNLKQ